MQIQRIQNLYLIIAFLLATVSLAFPWLRLSGGATLAVQGNIPLLILAVLATLLPLLAICLFKNLQRQKLLGRLSALFAVASLGYVVALSYLGGDNQAQVTVLAPMCMGLSGILDALAARAIYRDQQLLRAADRIR